jgi:hypothetical protein
MAITFVAAGTVVTGANPTVTVPAGTAKNDILIIVTTGTATPTTPAGWTLLSAQGAGVFGTILYRYATATEASVALTQAGNSTKAVMIAYRGAGAIQAIPAWATGTVSPATPNRVTTTYVNDFVISVYLDALNNPARTWTANASTTSRVNSANTTTITGMLIADELQAAAGLSTARAATLSGNATWGAFAFALIPTRIVYWVGGNGTWAAPGAGTTGVNWADASAGAGGKIVPTQNDAVIINAASGVSTITLSSAVCGSLDTTGASWGPITGGITVNGSMTLSTTTNWTNAGTITFIGTGTISTNASVDITSSIVFDGVGQTFTLGSTLNSATSTTQTVTLTNGILALNTFNIICGSFSSNNTNNRAIISSSGGAITMIGTGGFNVNGTNLTVTGTPTVNVSNNSATALTITTTTGFTEANVFNFTCDRGTYALTLTTASVVGSLNFTGFSGTWAPGTATATIYGSLTLVTGMTFTTGTGLWTFAATTGTQTIISAGKTLGPITQSGAGGTVALGSALTMSTTGTYTYTAGTLSLSTFTLSCGLFVSTSGTRVIAFGTGNITTTGSGTAFNVVGTSLTYTGTPTVNISNNSATALTLTATSFTEATAFNFNITTGTYALTVTTAGVFKSLNFTGFTGTWAPGTSTATFYGSLTLVSGMSFTVGTGIWTFASTSATQVITSAGKTLFSITQSGAGGTVQLADALTLTPAATYTYTAGTLNLSNFTLSCGLFASTSGTRVIAFGTNSITVTGSGTAFNVDGTSLTYTGTPTINVSNNSATAATIAASTFTATNAFNFNITVGTYVLSEQTGNGYNNLIYTGFTGTASGATARTIYGNLTLGSGMTYTNTGTLTLSSTSATQIITSNGKTITGSITIPATVATIQLADALTMSTTATFTWGGGTLNLNSFTLTCGLFDASASGTRFYTWGATGAITCIGSGTVFNAVVGLGLFNTGTPTVNISNNSGVAATISAPGFGESQSFNFNVTTGTYALTLISGSVVRSLSFAGFTGSWSPGTNTTTFYGNLTLSSGMTLSSGTGVWTFAATSGTQTIASFGQQSSAITQNNSGATLQLVDALLSTSTYTYTAGTLNINSFTLSCLAFSSTTGTRVIQFGTGAITTTGSGTPFNVVGTSLTYTGTPTVNISNNSATAATIVAATGFTETNALSVNVTAGTYQLNEGGNNVYDNLDFTGFSGDLISASTKTIYGNVTLTPSMTTSGAGGLTFSATSGTQIITTNGLIVTLPISQLNPGATLQLADNLTMSLTAGFSMGTTGIYILNLNNFELACSSFSSTGTNTRTFQFGTGAITVTGSGATAFSVTGTGLTYTGTPTVNINNNSATATTVTTSIGFTEANALNVNIIAGTYTLTETAGNVYDNLNYIGFSGTASGATIRTIYGSLTLSPTMTYSNTGALTLAATSGIQVITTNGKPITAAITQSTAGGTVQIADTVVMSGTYTYTAGTLDINSQILSCSAFSSTTGTRVIQFGTGWIATTGSGTAFNAVGTGLTYTGTPTIYISNSGATATTVTATSFTESNALDIQVINGTYALNLTSGSVVRSLNFSGISFPNTVGFAGSWSPGAATATIYGDLTLVSGMTLTAGTSSWTFAATSGTQAITSAGKTLGSITQNGVGGTVQLDDSTTIASTEAYTLTNGTLDLNNKTLTAGIFLSNNSNTRVIVFGFGQISLTGNNATIFQITTATNFTYTGTPIINATYSGATGTRTLNFGFAAVGTEATVPSVNVTAGTDTVSIVGMWNDINFTGFSGTLAANARTIYGDLTLSSGMTATGGTGTTTFAATSDTQIITSNGQILDFPITVSGAGGTVGLADTLIVGSGRTLTVSAGTFNASENNVSAGSYSLTGGTIVMGRGGWSASGVGTVWSATGATIVPGTSTIILSDTSTAAKTFAGGGKTYNNLNIGPTLVSGTGAATYTFTGNNTWNTISDTKTAAFTVTLPASGTTTVNQWLAAGATGAVLTLNSSSAGVQSTLALAGPGPVTVNYMSIRDSTVTPSTNTWYAGDNSTNVSNNTGWIFAAFVPQAIINNINLTGVTITT